MLATTQTEHDDTGRFIFPRAGEHPLEVPHGLRRNTQTDSRTEQENTDGNQPPSDNQDVRTVAWDVDSQTWVDFGWGNAGLEKLKPGHLFRQLDETGHDPCGDQVYVCTSFSYIHRSHGEPCVQCLKNEEPASHLSDTKIFDLPKSFTQPN